jgi:hypothetical protein
MVVYLLHPESGRVLPFSSSIGRNAPFKKQDISTLSFYNETLGAVPAMAEQTYRAISRSVLVLEPVTTAIKNRKWEVKEAAAQHNAYVDTLVQLVQKLHGNLGDLQIPKPVHAAVLEGSVESIAEQLVEAYAAIKKTTDEGRALMQRDVKVLATAFPTLMTFDGF